MNGWLLGLALLGASTPPASPLDPRVEAQAAVLIQMVDEGVVAAAYHLALLAHRHPGLTLPAGANGYLAAAAAGGHRAALRPLGFRLIAAGSEVEGAAIIATAALLERPHAAAEFRLLPAYASLSAEQLETAFNRAIERLAGGRLADCAALPVPCPGGFGGARLRPSELARARSLAAAGPLDAAAIERLLAGSLERYSAFSASAERGYRARLAEENRRVTSAGESSDGDGPGRRERRAEQAARVLDATLPRDLARHRAAIAAVVAAINRHREPGDAVTLEDLLGGPMDERP